MAPSRRSPKHRKWTFLVYAVGGPELGPSVERDVVELQRAGSSDDVSVVVAMQNDATSRSEWFEIRPVIENKPAPAKRKIGVAPAGNLDEQVRRFLRHARRHYPADHHALIFWAHASGLQLSDGSSGDGRRVIRLRQLAALLDVFTGGERKLDLLGFCACAVSKAEFAIELASRVRYLVASQVAISTLTTWPFDRILEALLLRPELPPQRLAALIVQEFEASYVPPPVALTAINLEAEDNLTAVVNRLAEALCAAMSSPIGRQGFQNSLSVLSAFSAALKAYPYDAEAVVDILDLCERIVREPLLDETARTAASDILDMGPGRLILQNARSGPNFTALNGLSITAPDFSKPRWADAVGAGPQQHQSKLWQSTEWLALLRKVHRFAYANPQYLPPVDR